MGCAAPALLLAAEMVTAIAPCGTGVRIVLVNTDPISGALYSLALALWVAWTALPGKRRFGRRRGAYAIRCH